MNCDDSKLNASAFLDGELDDVNIRELFRHLAQCDSCWTYFQRIQRLHEVAGMVADRPADDHADLHNRSVERRPLGRQPDMSARPQARARIIVTPASLVLNALLMFIVGVVLTLFVVDGNQSLQQNNESAESLGLRLHNGTRTLIHNQTFTPNATRPQ